MTTCAGIKRDGGRCSQGVKPGFEFCYNHDPDRSGERRRNAARAGRASKLSEAVAVGEVDQLLRKLVDDLLERDLDPKVAVVANQLLNTRLRALEQTRKAREMDEIEREVEELRERIEADEARRTGYHA